MDRGAWGSGQREKMNVREAVMQRTGGRKKEWEEKRVKEREREGERERGREREDFILRWTGAVR